MNKKAVINRNYSLNKIQKQFIFGGLMLLLCSFNISKKSNQVKESLPKVKVIIDTDTVIKRLGFMKFGGFRIEDCIPFQDTMDIILNEPINDLYQLLCLNGDQLIKEHLWLHGEEIVIKGSIKGKEVVIDTVLNSPFYYYTENVIREYEDLTNKEIANTKIVNDFLLTEIKKNIEHPFSNMLASIFIEENIDRLDNLKILQELLVTQSQQIKGHIFSVHRDLNKLINVVSIELSNFKFNNSKGQLSNISIKKDAFYLLDFWFTSCAPCIVDHKNIQTQLTDFEDAGIQVIGISTDYNQLEWIEFLNNASYKWDNYIEDRESENLLSQHLGISSFPTYIVINGNGEIINRSNTLEKSKIFLEASKILK